ncbi:LytR/AlgR family response regulator transcription factor [Arsenicibacter rosenii]|uniref:DNA-binding response regulator n=1 Tax=Arsenicibacter rosenii TaxID=1750698 RepID=A0A1S2VCC1_9BACT|nr:LytTR family DNA-binding domain-containing protein [Arsenicibacter rosenii]OIN55578.1 DNA-binding response regulator [Arsenicibacter rosenii]
MTQLRCIAIDDEPFALEIIADNIKQIPFLELTATYSDPLEAMNVLKRGQVDLLFLDIQMPTITGLQFLRTMPDKPLTIITTAYQQYALDGFDLDVVDYLLKPIPFDRFQKAVAKAQELFVLKKLSDHLLAEPKPDIERLDSFVIYSEYKQIRIELDDVLYVEGMKDYVKIFLQSQPRPVLTRLNLKNIQKRLPEHLFCRVHQSFIVSVKKITAYQRTRLFIRKQEIPVGGRFVYEFERIMAARILV